LISRAPVNRFTLSMWPFGCCINLERLCGRACLSLRIRWFWAVGNYLCGSQDNLIIIFFFFIGKSVITGIGIIRRERIECLVVVDRLVAYGFFAFRNRNTSTCFLRLVLNWLSRWRDWFLVWFDGFLIELLLSWFRNGFF
jgi:hypothetical protein